MPEESNRTRVARAAAEAALVRVVHHYGQTPEFVLLGGSLSDECGPPPESEEPQRPLTRENSWSGRPGSNRHDQLGRLARAYGDELRRTEIAGQRGYVVGGEYA